MATNEQGAALQAFYAGLPGDTVVTCEAARRAHGRYLPLVRQAHDALKAENQKGKTFKAWCEAAGINYASARAMVSRAEAQEREARERAEREARERAEREAREKNKGGNVNNVNTPGDGEPEPPEPAPPEPPKPPKPAVLTFKFASANEYEQVWKCLTRVMKAHKVYREEALLYIMGVFDERVALMSADATVITQTTAAA